MVAESIPFKATHMQSLSTCIVLAVLGALLGLASAFLYFGWDPANGDPSYAMTASGYFAMVLGIVTTLALGIGLMALTFHSNRGGHDQYPWSSSFHRL